MVLRGKLTPITLNSSKDQSPHSTPVSMSSHHLGGFTAVEDVSDISPDEVVGLCSRVEARLTVSSVSDEESQTDGMTREETALIFILTSLMKRKCREVEAAGILNNILKHQQTAAHVSSFFSKVSAKYNAVLNNTFSMPGLHFKKMDWRFQANLASRSLLERCDPKLVMRITLEERGDPREDSIDLEADVATLENIVGSLEEAWNEANSPSVRKLCKKYSLQRTK